MVATAGGDLRKDRDGVNVRSVSAGVTPGKVVLNSIIALRTPTSIKTGEAVAALRGIASDFPLSIKTHGPDDVELTLLTVNEIQVAILNIAAPVPGDNFGGMASPNVLWPTAPQDISAHRAHVFVVPGSDEMGPCGELVARATVVTLISAAIVSITPAIGVYWANSENLVRPPVFLEGARAVGAEKRKPVEIWVRLYFIPGPAAPGDAPTLTSVTRGLRTFVGRELEFSPGSMPIDRLITRTFDIAGHLVNTGAKFKDGDTVGAPEDPKFLVHLAENGLLGDGPVYRITESLCAAH